MTVIGRRFPRISVAALVVGSALGACGSARQSADTNGSRASDTATAAATVAPAARDTAWKSLLDGTAAAAWRGYRSDTLPAGWRVVDGALTKEKPTGDIITREQFADFELVVDWKLERAGNAGLFYRGTEEYDRIYWSAPEYQLLDDAGHPDRGNQLTAAGAAYDMYPSLAGHAKPGGEWNSTRIVVIGPHVEHWLNGTKVVEYELGSAEWVAKVNASKFKTYPNYGRATRGHIAIQGDHEGMLALRNIRIREITR
jgi:hypothetical protein